MFYGIKSLGVGRRIYIQTQNWWCKSGADGAIYITLLMHTLKYWIISDKPSIINSDRHKHGWCNSWLIFLKT